METYVMASLLFWKKKCVLFQISFFVIFSRVYSVKPGKGLMKGDLQIFVVKISPPEVKTYKQKLTMRLNDNNKYDQVRVNFGLYLSFFCFFVFLYTGTSI